MKRLLLLCLLQLAGSCLWPAAAAPANLFYAMDTAFQRPGLTQDQQFALVKGLGFAGIAWHERAPAEARADLLEAEKHGLKMMAIYCAAQATPEGGLSYSPQLPALMEALKGHGSILWLHIGGKGPAFESLTGDELVIKALRTLADLAASNELAIAVYPHVGEWTARFSDAIRLAEVVNRPAFGVTLNLCHALAMGEEPRIPELLQRAAPLLKTVTINGADSGVVGPNWGRLIQTLDKGTYDLAGLLRQLKQVGFKGPIGFQGYGINLDATAVLTPTMAKWRQLTRAAD